MFPPRRCRKGPSKPSLLDLGLCDVEEAYGHSTTRWIMKSGMTQPLPLVADPTSCENRSRSSEFCGREGKESGISSVDFTWNGLKVESGEGALRPRLKDKKPILEVSVIVSLADGGLIFMMSRDLEIVYVSCLRKPVCSQMG
jgi:hypothetical protein